VAAGRFGTRTMDHARGRVRGGHGPWWRGVDVVADQEKRGEIALAPPIHPDSASKVFDRRVAKSGLPRIRCHDLRHTNAVALIARGQHIKVASERLGHSSTSFTMDRYGHVMPNLQSDAASAVAALVDGSS